MGAGAAGGQDRPTKVSRAICSVMRPAMQQQLPLLGAFLQGLRSKVGVGEGLALRISPYTGSGARGGSCPRSRHG